jgi:copper chaperone CopZ
MSKKRKPELQNKPFWATMLVFLVLSTIVILSFVSDSALTGNAAIQTISYGKSGQSLYFEIKNVDGVKSAEISFDNDCKGCSIYFTEDESIKFDGVAYQKFTLTSPNDDQIGDLQLTLVVDKSTLKAKGLTDQDITLYVNGLALRTTKNRETNLQVFYDVLATEMGQYVIGKRNDKPQLVTTSVDAKKPVPEKIIIPPKEIEVKETKPALAGQAVMVDQPEPKLWSKVKNFFKNFIG